MIHLDESARLKTFGGLACLVLLSLAVVLITAGMKSCARSSEEKDRKLFAAWSHYYQPPPAMTLEDWRALKDAELLPGQALTAATRRAEDAQAQAAAATAVALSAQAQAAASQSPPPSSK